MKDNANSPDSLRKIYSLIGLSTRAGFTASGEFMTEKSIKSGKACLVIVAEDASDNTKTNFRNMCTHYRIPMYVFGDKDSLGHAMGKEFRASLSINDKGLAGETEKKIKAVTVEFEAE